MDLSVWGHVLKARKGNRKKINKRQKKLATRKLSLKRAVKAAARTIFKHLVELPEKERRQNLATIGRIVKKKLKWRKRKAEIRK